MLMKINIKKPSSRVDGLSIFNTVYDSNLKSF